jgi:hypothetical protein
MSSKDTTRQKLVGSMRKTKAAAGITEDLQHQDTKPNRPKQSESVKTTRKQPSDSASVTGSEMSGIKGYQSGRRVWPD